MARVPLILWLVLAVCAPMWAVISGSQMFFLSDALGNYYPAQVVLARVLAEAPGWLPRWDPYLFCGHPLLADPQFHALYPPAAVFRFMPFPAAMGVFLALHLVLAAAGTAAFMREAGYGDRAAGIAALAFALGSHPSQLLAVPPVLSSWAWFPWVALAARRLALAPGTGTAVLLGVVMGWVAIAGYPPYLVYSAVLALIVVACTPGPRRPAAVAAAGAVAVAFAVAAALVVPFLGYLGDTTRAHALAPASAGAMEPWGFLGYLVPQAFLPVTTEAVVGAPGLWASLHYAGAVALALAVTGAALGRGDVRVRTASWLVAVGLALALGRSLPVLGPIIFSLPPLSFIRHPGLWGALADFGVAWLAAAGAWEIERRIPGRGGRRIIAGWGLALVFLASLWVGLNVWKFGQPARVISSPGWGKAKVYAVRMSRVSYPAALIGVGLLFLGLAARREIGTKAAVIVLGVAVWGDNTVIRGMIQPSGRAEWAMAQSDTEARLRESARPGAWGRTFVTPRWDHWGGEMLDEGLGIRGALGNLRAAMRMNLSGAAGVRQAGGNGPLRPAGTEAALESVSYYPTRPTDPKAAAVYDRLGVRWLITGGMMRISSFRLLHDGYARVYERPGPAPRPAWVEPAGAGRVRAIESRRPGEWIMDVEMVRPGGVVVSESWVRGWKVSEAYPGARAVFWDGGIVGIPLPAGRYRALRLVYEPWTVRAGFVLSLLAFAGLIVLAIRRR